MISSRSGKVSRSHRTAPWLAAAAGLCAATVTLIAGCSTGTSASGTAASAKPMSPHQAISLAADQSRRITSASSTMTIKVAGATNVTTTGSMQMRLKPTLLASAKLNISASGQTIPIREIVGSKAIYMKIPGLARMTGRPWLKIPLTKLSGKLGASLGQLLQNLQNSNPLDQTKILAVSKDARVTGTEVIGGVRTTKYSGSYSASAALASLSPQLRKLMAPALKTVTGDVRFTVWIDAQHQVRRVAETENVSGETVHTLINVTAINQPVQITLPPSSQVATIPHGLLNSGTNGGSAF
jgi:hypothetical protein